MNLPTTTEVRAIAQTELDDAALAGVIEDAWLIAEHCIAGLDEIRQRSIVKWLAAHLVSSTDSSALLASTKLGDAQDTFVRAVTGEGLKGTTYGQQALALDPNGCLARLGKARSTFEVV